MKINEAPAPMDAVKRTAMAFGELRREGVGGPVVDATVGVFHSPEDRAKGEMPEWYSEAEGRVPNYLSGYNWQGEAEYLEGMARLLFGDNVDMDKLAAIPTYGGSHAISLGNSVLRSIVPVGVPTWPNHKGLIESGGGVYYPYSQLDRDRRFSMNKLRDALNIENVRSDLRSRGVVTKIFLNRLGVEEDMSSISDVTERIKIRDLSESHFRTRKISPLIHAVCQNPLGVDIPEEDWTEIAEKIMESNMVLQVDLAYLGLGDGVEEDVEMLRFFKEAGVKMFVYHSNSKFHGHYGKERTGALFGVNLGENVGRVRSSILQIIRNTTSAIATRPQVVSSIIERDDDIREEQRKWLDKLRGNARDARNIINNPEAGIPAKYQLSDAKGPFLFAPDVNRESPLLAWTFPELAEKMDMEVPKKAKDFPSGYVRVAGVPTSFEEGMGLGGLRLALAQMSDETATAVRNTLAYAYERSGAGTD